MSSGESIIIALIFIGIAFAWWVLREVRAIHRKIEAEVKALTKIVDEMAGIYDEEGRR